MPYRVDSRSCGLIPVATAGAELAGRPSGSLAGTVTSRRAPLDPSMIVTVVWSSAGDCGLTIEGAAAGVVADAALPASLFGVVVGIVTLAIGSPPNGSSLKIAKPRNVRRTRASSPAIACAALNGSRYRRHIGFDFA